MNLKDLRRLLTLMSEHELAEIEVEENGRRVKLRKHESKAQAPIPIPVVAPPAPVAPAAPAPHPPEKKAAPKAELHTITSPMVGTFYRTPSPDAEPFVEVGATIGKDTSVCIIEAMKVMNEIKAEVEGRVVEILVANGEAVEFGQPLFVVELTAA